MIKRMEWEMVSRRRMFSFLGLAVASGLALRPTAAEAQTSGMERRVTSGAEGASNGVTSGAEARLHQNSLRQTRLRHKPRLRHKNSSSRLRRSV